jgi:type VI secretion system secreted protein Hcp
MAVDSFLKLGDLKGESIVDKMEDHIQVDSWNWGMSQAGTTHSGTGGGAGKVNVQDMSFSKRMDSSTPAIIKAVCNGAHFGEATLTCRKAGEKPLDYVIIVMKDVIITSYSTSGSAGADEVYDNFALNFASYKLSYQPQDNKGAKAGGAIDAEYDIAKNV